MAWKQGQCFLPLGEEPFAIGGGDVLAVEMGMFRSLWSHPGDQHLSAAGRGKEPSSFVGVPARRGGTGGPSPEG